VGCFHFVALNYIACNFIKNHCTVPRPWPPV